MSTTSSDPTAPAALPVLSKGKHRNPARGACFMEYTSVLAGERFTDSPRCVDPELAAVLRYANDTLSDEKRPALVPLLGRAIGLVVERPADGAPTSWRSLLRWRSSADEDSAAAVTERLHRRVSERFMTALGLSPADAEWAWYARHTRVSRLFWDLMYEPSTPETSGDYVGRLVRRLDLLHGCYEQSMRELGLPRRANLAEAAAGSVTVERAAGLTG